MSLDLFDDNASSPPPWDTSWPQRELVRLVEEQAIRGRVLQVGCGTGENVLYLAKQGCGEAWGVDASPAAIAKAKQKVEQRGIKASFHLGDPLTLSHLGTTFDTVLDFGVFHTLSDADHPTYVQSLASVLPLNSRLYLVCLSEHEIDGWSGLRRVTQAGIQRAFGEGWKINLIRRAVLDTTTSTDGWQAWFASIIRTWDTLKKA